MFTGIIEELGKIASLDKHAGGAKIKISAKIVTDKTIEGDSIAGQRRLSDGVGNKIGFVCG